MVRKRVYKGHSLVENVDDYTVLDIETTSLDSYYGEILEISAIKVRNKKEITRLFKYVCLKVKYAHGLKLYKNHGIFWALR